MEHSYKEFWEYQGYKIIDCLECGFKHLDPIPDFESVKQFYHYKYHVHVKSFNYAAISDEIVVRQLNCVGRNRIFSDVYRKVAELLGDSPDRRMIDIGCGHNLLAKYFQDNGWVVCGLEPGKETANYLRRFGLEIYETFAEDIETLHLPDLAFINIQFVLEHTRYPLDVLKKLYGKLQPGGILRVCVPNDFSEGQLAYVQSNQAEMKWVCLPDHFNYFSFDSLSGLLTQAGFREIYRTTNFPLEFLLLGGIDYYRNEEERQRVGPFVRNFERSWLETGREQALTRFYERLAALGWGRSIFMYAQKG
jgi:SAM-dependent methyltransferase